MYFCFLYVFKHLLHSPLYYYFKIVTPNISGEGAGQVLISRPSNQGNICAGVAQLNSAPPEFV